MPLETPPDFERMAVEGISDEDALAEIRQLRMKLYELAYRLDASGRDDVALDVYDAQRKLYKPHKALA